MQGFVTTSLTPIIMQGGSPERHIQVSHTTVACHSLHVGGIVCASGHKYRRCYNYLRGLPDSVPVRALLHVSVSDVDGG